MVVTGSWLGQDVGAVGQPGNATFGAAPNVDESFTIDQRAITVTAVTDTKVADGTTDSAGIPTINVANGTEHNHEPTERVSVAALDSMLDVAFSLLDEAAVA